MNNMEKFNFAGCPVPTVIHDPEGVDAKRAFHKFDSQGRVVPCREPELFQKILICKKAINMHIKMWADGYLDCMIPMEDHEPRLEEGDDTFLLDEFVDPPEWVATSLRNQIAKALHRKRNTKCTSEWCGCNSTME